MLLSYSTTWHISIGQESSMDNVKTNKLSNYINKSHLTWQATVLTYCCTDLQILLFKFLWPIKCPSCFAVAAIPLCYKACWTCQRGVSACGGEQLFFWPCQGLITCGSITIQRNTEAPTVCGKTTAPHSSLLQLWALNQWQRVLSCPSSWPLFLIHCCEWTQTRMQPQPLYCPGLKHAVQ